VRLLLRSVASASAACAASASCFPSARRPSHRRHAPVVLHAHKPARAAAAAVEVAEEAAEEEQAADSTDSTTPPPPPQAQPPLPVVTPTLMKDFKVRRGTVAWVRVGEWSR
jgi:hypothetical protein